MKSTETLVGGCDCGAVRYQLQASPLFVHACHCTWCQRETGSAFVVNVIIESANIFVNQDEVASYPVPTASKGKQHIFRCPRCLIGLWSCYGSLRAPISYLRAGTLDQPDLCPPEAHIYTKSKQDWLDLGPSANISKNYYKRAKTWPPESLERFKIATT